MTTEIRRTHSTQFTAYSGEKQIGRARIAIGDGLWEAYSTQVDPEFEGHGVGGQLARTLLDSAQQEGVKVVPSCWFIDGYIERHTDKYGNLRSQTEPESAGSADDPSCRIAPSVVTTESAVGPAAADPAAAAWDAEFAEAERSLPE